MADNKLIDVVLMTGQSGQVEKVRIDGNEFACSAATPIMQGRIGVSITIFNVRLSDEQLPVPENPAGAAGIQKLPGQL